MIELPKKITREFLLEHNSEEAYIARYTGMRPVKKAVRSPFRKDENPSCSFYRSSSGRIYLYDFARPEFTCDFIGAAMIRYGCNYGMALRLIAEDFGLLPKSQDRPPSVDAIESAVTRFEFERYTKIQITIGYWGEDHLAYWRKYGISREILSKFRVYRCETVYLNDNVIYNGTRNVFGYFYKNGKTEDGEDIEYWRIYFPGRKKMKFLSNWKKSMVQGYRQLPEKGSVLVVTKSLKDVMSMYSFGITAIAPNSEGYFLPEEMVTDLKSRFKFIVVMYDNDRPGLAGMAKIRRKYPEFVYVWIDRKYGCKDFSDLYEKYGREKTAELIEEMREHVKSEFRKKINNKKKVDAPKAVQPVAQARIKMLPKGLVDNWGWEDGP